MARTGHDVRSDVRRKDLRAEGTRFRELMSGATIETETTWTSGQLGPVDLDAIKAFLTPAVVLLERADEEE